MVVALPGVVVAAVFMAWLVADNLRTYKLRNALTRGGAAATVLTLAVSSAVAGDFGPFVSGVAGGAAMFALLFLVEFARPGALGFGTVKASVLPGLAAGALGARPWVAAVATLVVLLVGAIASGGRARLVRTPAGPPLALALAVACLVAWWW